MAARSLRKPVHALQGRREGTVMHFKLPVGHPRALWASQSDFTTLCNGTHLTRGRHHSPYVLLKWCIFHKRLEFARWPSLGAELVLCLGPASVFALLWNGSFWFGWACDANGLWFKLATKRGLSWPRGSALTVKICRREMLVVVETKLRFISNLGVNHTRKAATTWKILSF